MNKFFCRPKKSGFTLIELLLVVTIMGILAAIVLVSVSSARVKGRDAKRLSDMENFQGALEVYFAQTGHYPYTNCAGSNSWTSFDSPVYAPNLVCDTVGGAGVTLTQIMAPYIAQLKDPKSLGSDSGYLYINQGGPGDFCILIWRTPENMSNFQSTLVATNRCPTITNGQCVAGGNNALYIGKGTYAAGC